MIKMEKKMIFDKNQTDFPSETHRDIWNTGIHILPLEVTLTDGLREKLSQMSPDLPESCEQMQKCFLHLFGDMYENINVYRITNNNTHYRMFVDWGLWGEVNDLNDSLIIDRSVFDRFIEKSTTSTHSKEDKKLGIDMKYRLKLLERTGLFISWQNDKVILTNKIYPKMFRAIYEMAKLTMKGTAKVSPFDFFYCDFRKLCKDYKYDKYEHAHIFLNDGQREIADRLRSFLLENKMTRSLNTTHKHGFRIDYNYKKYKLIELNSAGNDILLHIYVPYERNKPETINTFLHLIEIDPDSDDLKKFFLKNLSRCRVCTPKCGCWHDITAFGKTSTLCTKGTLIMRVTADDVPSIEKIIGYIITYMNTKMK